MPRKHENSKGINYFTERDERRKLERLCKDLKRKKEVPKNDKKKK